MEERRKNPKFEVIVLGIILDPESKKILIGKRKEGDQTELLEWCFPGGRLRPGEDIDDCLKEKLKLKTGYSVKNIGTFFSQTYEQLPGTVSISFLTRIFEGEGSPGDDMIELRWVKPSELENYFNIPMHKKLKEFLSELI